jgi:glycerol-3-phosphate dehydrogenase subunit B
MPAADVVVIGAGLSGLTCAHALAARGARVIVLAKGMATTHWTAGSIDVAAPPGASTAREGVRQLAAQVGHPYAILRRDVEQAVHDLITALGAEDLAYAGDLDSPIRTTPTGIGGTRPVSIVPDAQADALPPWGLDETLIVCGIAGFKDLWPTAVTASLARPEVWSRAPSNESRNGFEAAGGKRGGFEPAAGPAPGHVAATTAELPNLAGRHNLTGLHLARAFDDSAWRPSAIDAIARAVDSVRPRGPVRVALPAVLGLRDHVAVIADLRDRFGVPVFELPLVPPSIPGMRLFDALRRALLTAGARIQIGESVSRFESGAGRVSAIATPAAVREFAVRTGAVVLASGGIAGGGLVASADGRLEDTILGLPVEAPARDDWFSADPFEPRGHPLERAGVRVDADLRPVSAKGQPIFDNVRVVGSSLAGQTWLRERCGDGVAVASGYRAAMSLSRDGFAPGAALPATADSTGSAVAAGAGDEWRDR